MKIGILSFFGAIIIGPIVFVFTISTLQKLLQNTIRTSEAQNIQIPARVNTKDSFTKNSQKVKLEPAVIIQIIDFNTVKVLLNDGMQEIDLIGVVPNDACEKEAVNLALQEIALGKKAYMVDDDNLKDKNYPYKYIFLDNLTFLNQEIIARGIARADKNSTYIYESDFAKLEDNSPKCTITPSPKKAATESRKSLKETDNLYTKLLVTATPVPTNTPTPTPAPTAETNITSPSQNSNSKPSSLNPEILFALINNHRASIGKPAFEKHADLCSLAVSRGPELYDEIFVNSNVHAGLTNRNLPYWITENMASYPSEDQVFSWWMNSSLHRRAIEGDFKYSCGECYGNSCAQLFTSYTPK